MTASNVQVITAGSVKTSVRNKLKKEGKYIEGDVQRTTLECLKRRVKGKSVTGNLNMYQRSYLNFSKSTYYTLYAMLKDIL